MCSTISRISRSSSSRNPFNWSDVVIFSSALISVFFTSSEILIKAIFASSTFVGIPECSTSLSITIPCTNSVSSIRPPTFFTTSILSISTTLCPSCPVSAIPVTAFTAISERNSRDASANLPVIEVLAIFFKSSSLSTSISEAISFSTSRAFSAASL